MQAQKSKPKPRDWKHALDGFKIIDPPEEQTPEEIAKLFSDLPEEEIMFSK